MAEPSASAGPLHSSYLSSFPQIGEGMPARPPSPLPRAVPSRSILHMRNSSFAESPIPIASAALVDGGQPVAELHASIPYPALCGRVIGLTCIMVGGTLFLISPNIVGRREYSVSNHMTSILLGVFGAALAIFGALAVVASNPIPRSSSRIFQV